MPIGVILNSLSVAVGGLLGVAASGTGIYGSIVSGMTGDHTILISKSVLDLFTAAIFGCTLRAVVSLVAIPQCIIFLLLFYAATAIYPLTNEAMIADFKACGGFVLLATGFRMIRVKMFPIADMIPAMILVMPRSANGHPKKIRRSRTHRSLTSLFSDTCLCLNLRALRCRSRCR